MSAGISVNNNVINTGGAPSISENLLSLRPNAGILGRLFISTDTLTFFRDNGATWDTIGGGGGSQNIDQVLAQGGQFTTDRSWQQDGQQFQIFGYSTDQNFALYNNPADNANYIILGNNLTGTNYFISDFYNKLYQTVLNGSGTGIFLDLNNKNYKLGDFNNNNNGNIIEINDNLNTIASYSNTKNYGFKIDYANSINKFGDNDSSYDGLYLSIDNNNNIITLGDVDDYSSNLKLQIQNNGKQAYFLYNNFPTGWYCDFNVGYYVFGDVNNLTSKLKLIIDGSPGFRDISLGDVTNSNNKTNLYLSDAGYSFSLVTGDNFGLYGNQNNSNSSRIVIIGDWDGQSNTTAFYVDDFNRKIYTDNGLRLDNFYFTYQLGDYNNYNNGYYLMIDDQNTELVLNGTNFISATAGSNSSNHLVIKINGTVYKIQLKNP